MASSKDIEVVGYPDSSPVLRRSSSAESVNDESPFQEPMMEVEEEFAPTSRPTLRFTEPELAEQTQVPRKGRVATRQTQRRARRAAVTRCQQVMKRDQWTSQWTAGDKQRAHRTESSPGTG